MKTPELEAETKRQWLLGLVDAGIRRQAQIDAGLARCRLHGSPFLPSIGQFVGWCLEGAEDDSNLPSETDARLAMMAQLAKPMGARNWAGLHPAVYWASLQRSTFDWKNMKTPDLKSEFSVVWAEVKRMVRQGFDFNAALPAPERDISEDDTPAPVEFADKASRQILSMFDEGESNA